MLRAALAAIVLSYSFVQGFKACIVFALLVNRYFAFGYSSFVRKTQNICIINVFNKVFLFISETYFQIGSRFILNK